MINLITADLSIRLHIELTAVKRYVQSVLQAGIELAVVKSLNWI